MSKKDLFIILPVGTLVWKSLKSGSFFSADVALEATKEFTDRKACITTEDTHDKASMISINGEFAIQCLSCSGRTISRGSPLEVVDAGTGYLLIKA